MDTRDAIGEARLLARIVAEYREMPGLALTLDQACRLWACDRACLQRIANALIARHVLRWSRDGRLIRDS